MATKLMEELCLSLNISIENELKMEAMAKWNETSNSKHFSSCSKQTKTILRGVCLYITVLQYKKALTISQMCHKMGCNGYEFGKVYSQTIRCFPLYKTQTLSIEDLVGVTLIEANFDDKERDQLNERVIQLIGLERECWLIEGRSPVHIIFGAAYLAWKSLNPNLRAKVKLTQFCSMVSIDYRHTTSERVTELFNALKTLASKIPGKEKFKFTKQNIAIYINDILKYRNSLLYDLNKQIIFRNANSTQNSSIHWMNAFKRKTYDSRRPDDEKRLEVDQTNLKVKNPTEDEISDTEIDSYIRSTKEVKLIKKLKKLVENEDRDQVDNDHKHYIQIEDYIKVEGFE